MTTKFTNKPIVLKDECLLVKYRKHREFRVIRTLHNLTQQKLARKKKVQKHFQKENMNLATTIIWSIGVPKFIFKNFQSIHIR